MTYSETLRVGVLFGGRSGEHEVSLNSAKNVMNALQEAGHTVVPIGITAEGRWLAADDPMQQLVDHAGGAVTEGDIEKSSNYDWALLPSGGEDQQMPAIDVLFPVLHGPYGEDGTIQGLLEMANLPYVGCGVLSSAVGMDKAIAKKLFAQEGLHQTPHRVLMRQAWQRAPEDVLDEIMARSKSVCWAMMSQSLACPARSSRAANFMIMKTNISMITANFTSPHRWTRPRQNRFKRWQFRLSKPLMGVDWQGSIFF